MDQNEFESVFVDWSQRSELLDKQLHPIVHAEVDISASDWLKQLENSPHPADALGLRNEITSLFNQIVASFESLNAKQRQRVIDLMDEKGSLIYSAVLDVDRSTTEGFRKHMILFVIEDQGKDTRDAIVTLDHYRKDAEKHGIDVDSIFQEMAKIASTRDKYGWGTTRSLLLKH
jgi:hypothetical protein